MNNQNKDSYPWRILVQYFLDILLFIIAIAIFILACIASENYWLNESNWLQRFSSAIIVIAIVIDYRHFNYYKANPTHQSVLSKSLKAPYLYKFARIRHIIGWLSIPLIAIGTIFSGFGDMLFKP